MVTRVPGRLRRVSNFRVFPIVSRSSERDLGHARSESGIICRESRLNHNTKDDGATSQLQLTLIAPPESQAQCSAYLLERPGLSNGGCTGRPVDPASYLCFCLSTSWLWRVGDAERVSDYCHKSLGAFDSRE